MHLSYDQIISLDWVVFNEFLINEIMKVCRQQLKVEMG